MEFASEVPYRATRMFTDEVVFTGMPWVANQVFSSSMAEASSAAQGAAQLACTPPASGCTALALTSRGIGINFSACASLCGVPQVKRSETTSGAQPDR